MAKVFTLILVVLIVWIQYQVWYGVNGQQKIEQLSDTIAQQKEQNNRLVQQNKALIKEIYLLRNNPDVLEEKAREHLGLIKKGELFYRIIPAEMQ